MAAAAATPPNIITPAVMITVVAVGAAPCPLASKQVIDTVDGDDDLTEAAPWQFDAVPAAPDSHIGGNGQKFVDATNDREASARLVLGAAQKVSLLAVLVAVGWRLAGTAPGSARRLDLGNRAAFAASAACLSQSLGLTRQ